MFNNYINSWYIFSSRFDSRYDWILLMSCWENLFVEDRPILLVLPLTVILLTNHVINYHGDEEGKGVGRWRKEPLVKGTDGKWLIKSSPVKGYTVLPSVIRIERICKDTIIAIDTPTRFKINWSLQSFHYLSFCPIQLKFKKCYGLPAQVYLQE